MNAEEKLAKIKAALVVPFTQGCGCCDYGCRCEMHADGPHPMENEPVRCTMHAIADILAAPGGKGGPRTEWERGRA